MDKSMRYHIGQNYYSQNICLTEVWAAVNFELKHKLKKRQQTH